MTRHPLLTVGQVAQEYGVTVRTLHHYDQVGLLVPSGRSHAAYRLYDGDDVERLQHIVVYRRLGFSLEQITELLEQDADVVAHLRSQRASVIARREELDGLVGTIDAALEAQMNGYQISKDEQRELFGAAFDDDYAREAEQRWGDTEAWAQSQRRTRGYTKEQWAQVAAESEQINESLAAAMRAGEPADGPVATAAAEAHREHICRWFYDCSPQMHAGIAELYVTDPRFMQTYEDVAPGLAQYVRDAVVANAGSGCSG